jgi:hypothetical protein
MSTRALNILHVCDDLGGEGSRVHGLARLLAWMLPRFDAARFHVSLASLRKKDPAGDTFESLGVAISYLHRSAFDPATLTALLKIIDHRSIDLLHLHGPGAAAFGRLAAAMRRLPTVLHEHAGLTRASWHQKAADRALARFTDVALAESEEAADFVIRARFVPAHKVKVIGAGCDDGAYVRKLERLYTMLHDAPRHRAGTLERDLSFLTSRGPS